MATFSVNAADSVLKWHGEKKIGKKHHGTIDVKEGELQVEGENVLGGRVVVDMASITDLDMEAGDSMKATLEKHLKSADFFDVESYPTAEVVMEQIVDGKVIGKLTIKGHTESIEFPVMVEWQGSGGVRVSGEMTFDRSAFDVRYGSGKFFKGLGDELIYDDITIEFFLVAAA